MFVGLAVDGREYKAIGTNASFNHARTRAQVFAIARSTTKLTKLEEEIVEEDDEEMAIATSSEKGGVPSTLLSPDAILRAIDVIDRQFLETPTVRCERMSESLGADVSLKLETLNPLRSFKGRGADNFVASIASNSTLVCASAGNAGLALSFCASRRGGTQVVVFVPASTSKCTINRLEKWGATVFAGGVDYDDAKLRAKTYADAAGARFVEGGESAAIAEGAGTIGVEILAGKAPDCVVVPCGGGALLAGIACWLKHAAPAIKVIGVCSEGAPAMEISWRARKLCTTPTVSTIARGLAVRTPSPSILDNLMQTVDDMVLVSDANIERAMRAIDDNLGIYAEPSGAAGIAALMSYPSRFRGKSVVTLLTGANPEGDT